MMNWLAAKMGLPANSTGSSRERTSEQNLARKPHSRATRSNSDFNTAADSNSHNKHRVSDDDVDEIAFSGTHQPRKRGRPPTKVTSMASSANEFSKKSSVVRNATTRSTPASAPLARNACSTTAKRSAPSSPTTGSRPTGSRRPARNARTVYTRCPVAQENQSPSSVRIIPPLTRQHVASDEADYNVDGAREGALQVTLERTKDFDNAEGEETVRHEIVCAPSRLARVVRTRGSRSVSPPTQTTNDMQHLIRVKKEDMIESQDAVVGTSGPEGQDQVEHDHKYIASPDQERAAENFIENGAEEISSASSSRKLPATVDKPSAQSPSNELPTAAPESAMSETPTPKVDESITTTRTSISVTSMDKIKRRVLAQLNRKLPVPIVGLDDAYRKIYTLLEQTVLAPTLDIALGSSKLDSPSSLPSSTKFHGGNSALLLGPRASGKSLIISTALAELERKYRGQFIVVRLSGFAQTDDKQALQEIAAQIEYGRRALDDDDTLYDNLDDEANEDPTRIRYKRQSSRVVLERLLSLFSGRAGVRDDNDEPSSNQQSQMQQPVVSVLIILDEFEQFATMQNRQTLLYNLLDVAQSPRYSLKTDNPAPNICIIGVSSRMNAPEMLEKRVRSRFSHRVIVLPHADDLESFWRICSSSLKVTSAPTIAMMRAMVNARRHKMVPLKKSEYTIDRRATEVWNSYIDDIYSSSPEIRRLIARAFATSKDPRQVHMQFLSAVRKAGQTIPFLAISQIVGREIDVLENAGIMEKVTGLSELSLMLLICAARAEIKYSTTASVPATLSPTKPGAISNTEGPQETTTERILPASSKSLTYVSRPVVTRMAPISFTIAYEEYLSQAGKTRLAEASAGALITMPFRVWSREQAVAAWEVLERRGLLVNASETLGTGSTGGGIATSEMQVPEVGLMELGEIVKDMRGATGVVRQWCAHL
ncbi:hypothetical protein V1506DRAFT_535114 [Lipomyces tetrasporus]